MADIRVEKKSTSIWPYLLGLLFLVLAGLFLFGAFDGTDDAIGAATDKVEMEDETVADGNSAKVIKTNTVGNSNIKKSVAALSTFVETPNAEMNLEHDYTRKGLRMLSASLESMTEKYGIGNVQLQEAKALMMEKVAVLDNNPNSTEHADHIQEAFMSATKVLEQIQQKYLPGMSEEVRAVCEEAKQFSANELTLHQKEEVKSFFSKTAATITSIANALEKQEDSMG